MPYDNIPNDSSVAAEAVDVEAVLPERCAAGLNVELTQRHLADSEQKLQLLHGADLRGDDWEEDVKRDSWTPLQQRVFSKVNETADPANPFP